MSDPQLTHIAQDLGELVGVTREGFKGVHQRQDLTNGRVLRLEGRMEDVEKKAQAYEAANQNDAAIREQLKPIIELYRFLGTGKAVIISLAAILSSIGVIIVSAVYVIQFFRGV